MAGKRPSQQPALDEIAAARVAAGTCRHCAGPVPCWSPFGDAEVGRAWREMTVAEQRKIEANRWR